MFCHKNAAWVIVRPVLEGFSSPGSEGRGRAGPFHHHQWLSTPFDLSRVDTLCTWFYFLDVIYTLIALEELGKNPVERLSPVDFPTHNRLLSHALPHSILSFLPLCDDQDWGHCPNRLYISEWWSLIFLGLAEETFPSPLLNIEHHLGVNEFWQQNLVLQLELGPVPLPINFLVQLRHLGKHLKKVFILWANNKCHKVVSQSFGFGCDFCTKGVQTVATTKVN